MKRIGFLIALSMLACSSEVGYWPDDPEGISVSHENVTGTNPIIDTDYVRELSELPAGLWYTDLGVSSGEYFLARNDRKVEVRAANFALVSTIPNLGEHVDWIQTGEKWDLISANNSAQQIYRLASSGSPKLMGNFPAGTTTVHALTARQLNENQLEIYIIGGTWPNEYLQKGNHHTQIMPLGIAWDPTKTGFGPYSRDLTFARAPGVDAQTNRIYFLTDYTTSHFRWYNFANPPTNSWEAGLPPYTEHAYTHPEGEYDKFAPVGFDYREQDDYFYGIDRFGNQSTGRIAWVVARMHRNRLRP